VKLRFLPAAAHDLVRLRLFIETKNPQAAARIALRLYAAAESLIASPELGRPIEGTPFRKLTIRIRRTAYVVHYRISPELDAVTIVRIWHGRERQR
jgi:plasmid stabilization system protein ParE